MAIPSILLPILAQLAGNGLGTVSDAIQARGKQFVEEKLGVEIKPDMDADELDALRRVAVEHEATLKSICEQAATTRHRQDAKSDSWLSKNIRPLALLGLMGMFGVGLAKGIPADDLTVLRDLLVLGLAFYFGTGVVEKLLDKVKRGER